MAGLTGLYVARDGSSNGTTPKGARLAQAGLIQWNSTTGAPAEGVFADDMTAVVAGKANMSYDVRAFVGTNRLSASVGPVVFANDAVVNVVTTAAPGSNSRHDVIWVRQHLVASDGGADTDVILEFGVTQGTVAASPTVPAVPTGALALGRFQVTASVTATSGLTYTRIHEWIAARGGIVPTTWTAVSFTNSWANYGSGYQTVQYRKVGDEVQLRGVMKLGSLAAAFTLPTGFRPPATIPFGVLDINSGVFLAYGEVATTGVVSIVSYSSGGSNAFVDLSSIRFSVTA